MNMAKTNNDVDATNSGNKRKSSSSPSRDASAPKTQKKTDVGNPSNSSNNGNSGGGGRPVTIVESFEPLKSTNDPNEYKVIKLSNGLRVCLVSRNPAYSDTPLLPLSAISAIHPPIQRDSLMNDILGDPYIPRFPFSKTPYVASLEDPNYNLGGLFGLSLSRNTSLAAVVNVGGLDDPQNSQGLSHLSQHVFHFGSRKFPQEEALSELLSHFGGGNAFTTQLNTAYYNNVNDALLDKNLELFSEMLRDPLMDADLIQREIQAVDDEFYLMQPMIRKQLLLAHVGYEPIHPLARVWIGKLETLGQVQEKMKTHHKNNYVASAMTLAIDSTKSIPELEQLVVDHFSKLQQGGRKIRHETNQQDFSKYKLKLFKDGRHIFLQGISSTAELTLRWHIPTSISLHKTNEKTMEVIEHLLSNSSDKGLIAYLKNEELIWAANVYQSSTPYAILLEMEFILTEKGRSKESTSLILKATDEYVKLLQQVSKEEMSRYFDQLRIQRLKKFEFGEKPSTLQTALECAMKLQDVKNPKEILSNDSWYHAVFNFAPIQEILGRLRLTSLPGVTVIETLPKQSSLEEKLTEIQVTPKPVIKEAPYTKARFFDVPRTAIKSMTNFSGALAFPSVSNYLERDLRELRSGSPNLQDAVPTNWNLIAPIYHEDIRMQFLQYRSTGQSNPSKVSGLHLGHMGQSYQGVVTITFHTSKNDFASPRGAALSWLWVFCIRQSLATFATDFALAGYNFTIQHLGGLVIRIRGFPTQMADVSTKIVGKVFDRPITESTFNLAKEELKQNWEIYLGETSALTEEIMSTLIYPHKDLDIDIFGTLDMLTLKDLNLLIKAHREATGVTIGIVGNIPVSVFNTLAATLDNMEFAPSKEKDKMPFNLDFLFQMPRPNLLTPGETCVRLKNKANCTFTNTVTNMYILGASKDKFESECFKTAMRFMNQQAFTFLRTKKQLGFVTRADTKMVLSKDSPMIITVGVVATAKKHTLCELDQKIDEFLSEYGDYMTNIPDEIFQAKSEEYQVTKAQVGEWFNSKFGHDFRHQDRKNKCLMKGIRKVSIQQIGAGNPMSETKKCDCEACRGIQKWVLRNNQGSHLEFAVGDEQYKNYFVQV